MEHSTVPAIHLEERAAGHSLEICGRCASWGSEWGLAPISAAFPAPLHAPWCHLYCSKRSTSRRYGWLLSSAFTRASLTGRV